MFVAGGSIYKMTESKIKAIKTKRLFFWGGGVGGGGGTKTAFLTDYKEEGIFPCMQLFQKRQAVPNLSNVWGGWLNLHDNKSCYQK